MEIIRRAGEPWEEALTLMGNASEATSSEATSQRRWLLSSEVNEFMARRRAFWVEGELCRMKMVDEVGKSE